MYSPGRLSIATTAQASRVATTAGRGQTSGEGTGAAIQAARDD
jgi:hypothetical protein